jgi:cytochrome c553
MSRTRILSIIVSSVPLACMSADAGAQIALDEVAWAYAIGAAPAQPTEPDDGTLHSVPGSERQFTRDQIRNFFGPADWFPGDHPVMPPIVAQGREPAAVWACSMCHYPNGQGRPENAGIAGLPRDYFIQQMRDLRDGRRGSAEPRKTNTNLMIGFARAMTDREIEQAADYFSSMAWRPWIDVIETEQVPKTRIQGGMHLRLEGAEAGTERSALGLRRLCACRQCREGRSARVGRRQDAAVLDLSRYRARRARRRPGPAGTVTELYRAAAFRLSAGHAKRCLGTVDERRRR